MMRAFQFRLLLLTPLVILSSAATAQENSERLVEHHRKIGALKNSMPGYRVQVFFGSERQKAQEVKSQTTALYTDLGVYLVYQQPNFKVRIGDFKTRLDATRALREIQLNFPGAFIVPDEVKLPEL